MKLLLKKPIAFFDIESTSKDPQIAKIIELGIIVLHPDGNREQYQFLCNPGESISDENAAIHGFTNEKVKDFKPFRDYALHVKAILTGCDLAGFNSNAYDIPLLSAEFERERIDIDFSSSEFVDVGVLFKLLAPRTLTAAVLAYLGKDHAGAHGAIADTEATIEVLDAMLVKHKGEVAFTVPELALKSNYDSSRCDLAGKFKYNQFGVIVFNFGKHKDKPAAPEKDYLNWMKTATNANQPGVFDPQYKFALDTRKFIDKIFLQGQSVETAPKTMVGGSFNPPRGYDKK